MRIKRWTGSLVVRTSVFLLLVIILAQVLSGIIWYQHASERDKEGLSTTVKSLAL
ncbi:two-component sensor histidine kinase, partial [Vibrio sp. 2094]|nr:two-component sensor histidine kinase [Vibrio sp. 2094]